KGLLRSFPNPDLLFVLGFLPSPICTSAGPQRRSLPLHQLPSPICTSTCTSFLLQPLRRRHQGRGDEDQRVAGGVQFVGEAVEKSPRFYECSCYNSA
ncbi:hypothetical protein Taro_037328, partial [Colocasia esculenta]|nr:hypothetical protein [Colocasia esculenta]